MDFLAPIPAAAMAAALVLLLAGFGVWWRRSRSRPSRSETLDTVQAWAPVPTRVMTISERQAYELLRRALPCFTVLAQVPLSRFIRVPARHAYREWLQRVGALSADLLVCDAGSRVLSVIDIRAVQESERSQRRHDRLARVLQAAGIHVQVWREGSLPTLATVRASFGASLQPAAPVRSAAPAGRGPLIPVAEIEELLAAGDARLHDTTLEPVPSAFFEDLEAAPPGRR